MLPPTAYTRLGSTCSQGSVAFAIDGIRARSAICPRQPQEWSGSRRPMPPGQMTANPCAGSSRQSRAFVAAWTPRPCGEITSGRRGVGFPGPYSDGTITTAGRGSRLWAW